MLCVHVFLNWVDYYFYYFDDDDDILLKEQPVGGGEGGASEHLTGILMLLNSEVSLVQNTF